MPGTRPHRAPCAATAATRLAEPLDDGDPSAAARRVRAAPVAAAFVARDRRPRPRSGRTRSARAIAGRRSSTAVGPVHARGPVPVRSVRADRASSRPRPTDAPSRRPRPTAAPDPPPGGHRRARTPPPRARRRPGSPVDVDVVRTRRRLRPRAPQHLVRPGRHPDGPRASTGWATPRTPSSARSRGGSTSSSRYDDSHNGGWGPSAMAEALAAYGVPGYEVRAYATREMRSAARRSRSRRPGRRPSCWPGAAPTPG